MATTNVKDIIILNQLSPNYAVASVLVSAGAVGTIVAGSPTKAATVVSAATWYGDVIPMVDADGTTAQRFGGIAASTSTDTVAAAGAVDLYLPYPGIMYAGKALLSTTFDTQAEVTANFGKGVFFDLTAAVWTVDVAATAAAVNCLIIVGGDYRTQTVWFNYKANGTFLNHCISA